MLKGWLGGIGWTNLGSRPIDLRATQIQHSGKPLMKYIWRNKGEEQYKISKAYLDNPLELSHYLLVRTRELMFLTNKAEGKLKVAPGVAGSIYNSLTESHWEQSLAECKIDLEQHLKQL